MDFQKEVKKLGIELSANDLQKFKMYYENLIEVNQYMNLTAITDEDEVYRKHFLDSLQLCKILDITKSLSLCDVGSGAGFPSIPLAIVGYGLEITILDALNKRIQFLSELVKKLELKNVIALHKRAEEYIREMDKRFDVVTARAVARMNVLVELCLPLVKMGGIFIAMKGLSGKEELAEAKRAILLLGGQVEKEMELELPDEAEKRILFVIRKVKETPSKYPRAFAKIKERPL